MTISNIYLHLTEELIVIHQIFQLEKYYLEVSSPGIDRPLKKDKDFTSRYGQKVDLAFYEPWEGMKAVTGILVAHDADTVSVRKIVKGRTDAKASVIERKLIATVKPHIDF